MQSRHAFFLLPGLLLAGAVACQAPVDVPHDDVPVSEIVDEVGLAPGQSALLSGMHDIESAGYVQGATAGGDKGWITDLQYIGTSGHPAANCHASEIANGISILQRLDVDGAHSYPDAASLTGYVDGFAAFAAACPQIHVWIVGNEPNVTANNSDPATYAAPYAEAYVRVRARVHALAGHGSDFVLMSPASPYSPFCICSMRRIIQEIVRRGGQPDGFAVHAYTQAQHPSDFGSLVGLVTSNEMNGQNDGCGFAFHRQFRIYQDWISALEAEGQARKPVFITEAGNACAPERGNLCYPNQNLGYFQAMYQEIRTWNASHVTKVRAITPYRWTGNDDGSGRDFAIGTRGSLQADLTAAFSANLQAPARCDNNVVVGNTACNPSDPGAQFICTNPGMPSDQQWTRQACPSGQSCSGTRCQSGGGPPACGSGLFCAGNQIPGSSACTSGPNTIFCCPSGQTIVNGACSGSAPPACGSGLFCAGNQIPGSSACRSGSNTIFCCPLGQVITNGACSAPPACGSGLFCAGNAIPGASPCTSGSSTIFCCASGHTIVNGACS